MEIENQKNMYRLRYFDPTKPRESSHKFNIFTLPLGMTEEESFQVLSYLIDVINLTEGYAKDSYQLTEKLNSLLETIGFKEKFIDASEEKEVIELFIVKARENKMGYNRITKSYFDWYTPYLKQEAITAIYENLSSFKNPKLKLAQKI